MVLRIRLLKSQDYDAVIELFRVCGLNPRTRGRDSPSAFSKQLRANRTLYLGAFDRGRLVATVLGTHDTRKGWINRLAVRPDHRRRGIAARLVRACEREFRKQRIGIFAALIDGENVASQELFAKLGYETSDIRYYRRKTRKDV